MPKPKQITHYCEACHTKHTLIEGVWPFWNSAVRTINVGGVPTKTTYWYCNKGVDCAGCKTIHTRTGITKSLVDPQSGATYWICNKWFKQTGNGQVQWDNWSPQEVMSGVHYGEDRVARYGPDTEDHAIVHGEQVKALGEALDEIEGY